MTLLRDGGTAGSLLRPGIPGSLISLGPGRAYTINFNAAAGVIPARLTFSRASGGVAFPGGVAAEYGANVPRFQSGGLWIEGARTNQNSNPRGEGAVPGGIGSGGALPTEWAAWAANMPSGTVTVVGNEKRRGIDGVILAFSGTPTATTGITARAGAQETVTAGITVVNRLFIELLSGSMANVSQWQLRSGNEVGGTDFTPGSFAEIRNVRTLSSTVSSTTIRWNYVSSAVPVNATIWIGWPTREHAAFVSTPELPAVGTPAAATRAPDSLAGDWTTLAPNGDATILVSALAPSVSASSGTRTLVSADTDASNLIALRLNNNTLGFTHVLSGTPTNSANMLTSLSGDVSIRAGITISASRVAAFAAGASSVESLSVTRPSIARLSLGQQLGDGTSSLFGRIAVCRVIPRVLSDAELQNAVNALPVAA